MPMRILADENIARDMVSLLRVSGNDVLYAAEAQPGAPDTDWVLRALQDQRVILTSDKDFGELVFKDGLTSFGIVLIRLDKLPVPVALARLQAIWPIVESNPTDRFIVITENKVRVRPLLSPPSPGPSGDT